MRNCRYNGPCDFRGDITQGGFSPKSSGRDVFGLSMNPESPVTLGFTRITIIDLATGK
jgi:hypothetical protein